MVRSIAAVAGGFIAMTILVMAGTMALVAAFVPGGLAAMRGAGAASAPSPTPRYYAMNIALSFLAALVGGWVTTRIAIRTPAAHIAALGALLLAMGAVSAFSPGNEQQPGWYKLLIPVVGICGVAASLLFVNPAI
jgi:peptidoglycan/LPS O-acetylase OafA/YrhL